MRIRPGTSRLARILLILSILLLGSVAMPAQAAPTRLLQTKFIKLYLPLVLRDVPNTVVIRGSASDAELARGNCATWAACRTAPAADAIYQGSGLGSVAATKDSATGLYSLKRIFLFFNTADLPSNATITSVELRVYVGGTVQGAEKVGVIRTTSAIPVTAASFSSADLSAVAGSFTPTPNSWAAVNFTPAALGWVTRGGTTKLGLTYLSDVQNVSPTTTVNANLFLSEDATYQPYLIITYK